MTKQKIIIIATVFLDIVGYGLIMPTLPIYVQELTHSDFLAAAIFSIYSFCGFFAAPILGGLSDRYGRRPVLVTSLFGTAVGWFIFAIGGSIWNVVIGRIIDGITSGNISSAQSYLIDISKDDKDRAHNLGLIGATFGVGFIIGPAVGALLSSISMTLPFWCAFALAAVNTVAAYFFLPETNTNRDNQRKISLNPLAGIYKAFTTSQVSVLFIIWFLYTMTFASMHTIFALYTHITFDWSGTENGLIFTLMGFVMIFNQGFLLRKFWLKRFKEAHLEIGAAIAGIVAYTVLTINTLWVFISALVLQAFSQALLRVINNSEISGAAPKNARGELVGVIQSIMFFSAVLAPLIAGFGIEAHPDLPWILCVLYMCVALILLVYRHKWIGKVKPILNEALPQEEMVEL